MLTTANLKLKKPEGTDVVNIEDLNYNSDVLDVEINKRALKTDIPTIPVKSVNGKTGAVTVTKSDVGLSNVNNWGASAAINNSSDTIYATAGAVKKAYDKANASKVSVEELLNSKGQPNGIATLDENGKIPSSQIGGGVDVIYKGSASLHTVNNLSFDKYKYIEIRAVGYSGDRFKTTFNSTVIHDYQDNYRAPSYRILISKSGNCIKYEGDASYDYEDEIELSVLKNYSPVTSSLSITKNNIIKFELFRYTSTEPSTYKSKVVILGYY